MMLFIRNKLFGFCLCEFLEAKQENLFATGYYVPATLYKRVCRSIRQNVQSITQRRLVWTAEFEEFYSESALSLSLSLAACKLQAQIKVNRPNTIG